MKRLTDRISPWVLFSMILVWSEMSQGQEIDCPSAVTVNGGSIEVASDMSGDDTENIQCALDAAVNGGYRDVYLTSSSYTIVSINATAYIGDLRGTSKANTTVTIQDSSLSCETNLGVAMQFNTGTVSVRNMTIEVDSPCGDSNSAAVIGFYSNPTRCNSRTTFGVVDRVAITRTGTNSSDIVSGVVMQPAPGCTSSSERILGTLKINRSDMSQLEFGVITSVAGGGQVDINYNTFTEMGLPVTILDASQGTTILGNDINYNDTDAYLSNTGLGTTGVFVASTSNSPNTNGTIIKNNTFYDGGESSSGFGILLGQENKRVNHKLIVSSNTFEGDRDNTEGVGISAIDTRDGILAGNRFKSGSGAWVDLRNGDPNDGFLGQSVTGWAIVANTFSASLAGTDVVLASGTSGTVIGRGQGLPIIDDQTGTNDVLESSASSSSFYPVSAERFLRSLSNLRDEQAD